MPQRAKRRGLLSDARVYLSGPMDFVASRADEKTHGWRNRVGEFLRALGVTVFDPWFKPEVRGLHQYGIESESTVNARESWTFARGKLGGRARAKCVAQYWQTLHTDLRMVDTSDFIVAYVPTNIYSVGTPHEIALARQQRKPVLFVSPAVEIPALDELKRHLEDRNDARGRKLLEDLCNETPIKPNPRGIPSLWYMPLVGGQNFFDGFGFHQYARLFPDWKPISIDGQEAKKRPVRPLLPFLERVNRELPLKWDAAGRRPRPDDDWLLWDLRRAGRRKAGAQLKGVRSSTESLG